MKAYLSSERSKAETQRIAHLGRIAERTENIEKLKALMELEDKDTVLKVLKAITFSGKPLELPDRFDNKNLQEIKDAMQRVIGELEVENNKVPGLAFAIRNLLVGTVAQPESADTPASKPALVENDERLQSLVVEAINALPEAKRTVRGKVRTGEEIARAIPDVEAFLNEVTLRKEDSVLLEFFTLNESGQLVMKDDCPEAYGRGDNALQARIRQTRIVYRGDDGQTKVITGEDYFNVTEHDEKNRPLEMEVSEAGKKITPESILMASGLPTLKWDGKKHTGEYALMNNGQLERSTSAWTDDDSCGASRARYATWYDGYGNVVSHVSDSNFRNHALGSRRVLRVNLNLES